MEQGLGLTWYGLREEDAFLVYPVFSPICPGQRSALSIWITVVG